MQRTDRYGVALIVSRFVVATIVGLSGCATTDSSAQEVTQGTTVQFDPYAGTYSVTGHNLDLSDQRGFLEYTFAKMEGRFGKSGENPLVQLLVSDWSHLSLANQTGWKLLKSASDITGTPLKLSLLKRYVTHTSNSFIEDVAVDLPRDFIEARKADGLNIRISGTNGSIIVKVPAMYVAGFLEKFDAARAERKGR